MNPPLASERDAGPRFRLPSLTLLSLLVELALIVLAALFVTRPYMDFSPNMRLSGNEAEINMSSVYSASSAFQTLGYLPLWNPFLEKGEPLITNPTSMVFNPMTSWPSFVLGAVNGLKVSMILAMIFSGLGGWVLGRLLSFHWPGRLLLGVLCIARGGLHAVLLPGFIQFTMAQAHFSWIMAGAIGILWYRHRRWPLILTPVMLCLMFWVGIPWYVPAIGLCLAVLTLVHSVKMQLRDSQEPIWRSWLNQRRRRSPLDGSALAISDSLMSHWHPRIFVDRVLIGRMALAGVLAIGLSAITLVPQLAERNNIGYSSISADDVYPLTSIVDVFFNPLPQSQFGGTDRGSFFYNYTSPYWFIALLVIGIIAVGVLKRSRPQPLTYPPMLRWVIIAVVALIAFCVLWGAGINPIIEWSYSNVPLASSFRHVERVLVVASFLLAIVIAATVDFLWIRLLADSWGQLPIGKLVVGKNIRLAAALGLVVASGAASIQVLQKWHIYDTGLVSENVHVDTCLSWLRSVSGDKPLSVWSVDYSEIDSYLKFDIRHFHIDEDFYKPAPIASTLLNYNISEALPQYASTWGDWNLSWLNGFKYQPDPSVPLDSPNFPCFYARPDYFPYAWTMAKSDLVQNVGPLTTDKTIPISTFKRSYDLVGVIVNGSQADQVLSVQELAYPGWTVRVNGSPTKLEVVGGQIGVVLPAGTGQYQVLFQYRPSAFVIGAFITLFAWLLCLLLLLRAERFIPRRWLTDFQRIARRLITRIVRVLLNPDLMRTEDIYIPTAFAGASKPDVLLLSPPAPEIVQAEVISPDGASSGSQPAAEDDV